MAADPEPVEPPPSLLYAVKQVELAVRSHLDELLRPAGVTVNQYTALTVIQRGQAVTSAELARNSFVTNQSTADLVNSLERQALIKRSRDPDDRRRVLISLSRQGMAVVTEHSERVQALEQRMVASLTTPQVRALRRALNACRVALTETPVHSAEGDHRATK